MLICLQGDGSYDVVGRYHQRNRAPRPPNPRRLESHRQHDVLSTTDAQRVSATDAQHVSVETDAQHAPVEIDARHASAETDADAQHVSAETDAAKGTHRSEAPTDIEGKSRAPRHSQKCYTRSTTDLKKLGFYPPQWHDVLERAQQLWRPWMALECGFPKQEIRAHLDMAAQCVTDALSEHQKGGGKVENGSYLPF